MQGAEFAHFLAVAAEQAGFLELEIAELLLVFEVNVEFDELGADGEVLPGVVVGELAAAFGVNGVFEAGDAGEPPLGIGQRLDELGFAQAFRLVFGSIGGDVLGVGFGVVARKQDGAPGESGFDGV